MFLKFLERKLRKKRRKRGLGNDDYDEDEKAHLRKFNPDGSSFDPFFDNPEEALDTRPKRQGKAPKSNRGRKKIVPLALKTCSECGEQFQDHMGIIISFVSKWFLKKQKEI